MQNFKNRLIDFDQDPLINYKNRLLFLFNKLLLKAKHIRLFCICKNVEYGDVNIILH